MRWKLLLLMVFVAFSCRRTHECYVQDDAGNIHDTIICKCFKENIIELEASPFITDTGTYETDTVAYAPEDSITTVTYKVICD